MTTTPKKIVGLKPTILLKVSKDELDSNANKSLLESNASALSPVKVEQSSEKKQEEHLQNEAD